MAVKKTAQKKRYIRDYWASYRQQSVTIILTVQLTLCAIIVASAFVVGLNEQISWLFVISIIVITVIFATSNLLLFGYLSRPFRDAVTAIVIVSGEPTIQTPPNPNSRQYQSDGFNQVLQTIYELAAHNKDEPTFVPTTDDIIQTGLDQTDTGIIIIDPSRKIVYNNKKAPVRTNSKGDRTIDLLFNDDNTLNDWLDKCEKRSVHSDQLWSRIADRPAGEKGRRIFDVVASYQKNSRAETILTLFDRTEVYGPEEDDLDFISFAAHELRGPITVIRGYLDVLDQELAPVLQNDQAELLQRLTVSANRLSSYVNNILNASKYDRRHFKIHLNEETIPNIYDSIKDDMQLRAISQNRLLTIAIPENLPTVAADSNSIGEVLSNLIDNAVKYSNEGGQVTVTARQVAGFVEVSVTDRGIGMPGSVIPNLFHKFYRSHRSRETVAGTGIGLYITKAIVESHGGIVNVRSTEREGSTFSFTLPIYDTVAEKIKASNNSNEQLIDHGSGWIRNHSMFRG